MLTFFNLVQTDVSGLVSQLKDLQKKNADLEEINKTLSMKVPCGSYYTFYVWSLTPENGV